MEWQLQDAKNRFSKVVQRARHEVPQEITRRGERTAGVLSKTPCAPAGRRSSTIFSAVPPGR